MEEKAFGIYNENMKRFSKIYIETTNICNLSCSFCPGTARKKEFMSQKDFEFIAEKVKDYTDYIYLHLMGEPLLNPALSSFIDIAASKGLKVCLTTNGTLLKEKEEILLANADKIHKISISLQAQEVNGLELNSYIDSCLKFGKKAEGKTIVVYRLWNEGGENKNNGLILERMHSAFSGEWQDHPLGNRIGNRVYLETGEKFEWPKEAETEENKNSRYYCYGLRDQIGILVDGTVVPCCLDNDGKLSLGNIKEEELSDIISSSRAISIADGFSKGIACEALCRNCGFAKRFTT